MGEKAKMAKREYARKWRSANKEKVREYNKKYRENNKQKVKESNERYWEKKAAELEGVADGEDHTSNR